MKYFVIAWLLLTFSGPLWLWWQGRVDFNADYRTANRASAGIAPLASTTSEAVIQVYAARAFNWRGLFASHSWIALKPKGAADYTVYQVVGWNSYHGLPALTAMADIPDRFWYGAAPNLVLDMRGEQAEKLIPRIEQAAKEYPYAQPYTVWPGPNSNSFPAYIGRAVPELRLALPADAVGKDFLPEGAFFARAPSGTGYQLSLFGLLGVMIAQKEGIEINLLGMVYGVRFSPFTVLLPGWNG